ncbi:unnamed protein product [Rangifer tarandus platyrhynchus]|uniref:Uncharacterized protein n=1 Tax=Rangifer tarandus platyrhynchus TaxID=3082113 RepID=A0AC60A0T7_RANTA
MDLGAVPKSSTGKSSPGKKSAILCSSLRSQAPFPPSSSLLPPAPSPWDPSITILPSSFEPASPLIPPGTEGRWLFSICRARSWLGPSHTAGRPRTSGQGPGTQSPHSAGSQPMAPRAAKLEEEACLEGSGAAQAPQSRSWVEGGRFSGFRPQHWEGRARASTDCSSGRRWESFGAAEKRAATNGIDGVPGSWRWAGGCGGGWGATYVFPLRTGEPRPLLVAAAGGSRAYLKRQDRGGAQTTAQKLESRSVAPRSRWRGGAAGEGAGCEDGRARFQSPRPATPCLSSPPAGQRGRGGGSQGNAEVWAKLGWVAAGGFAGGGGGRDRSDASETDIPWTDEERAVFVIHPNSEFCL